jgi:hypothetical protein
MPVGPARTALSCDNNRLSGLSETLLLPRGSQRRPKAEVGLTRSGRDEHTLAGTAESALYRVAISLA